jgi:enterochelin esterase-like enzyme
MVSIRTRRAAGRLMATALAAFNPFSSLGETAKSHAEDGELTSKNFAGNKVGISPVRKMTVYLPAGYDGSATRYPVIYFLPTAFEGYRAPFDKRNAQELFDRVIAAGVIDRFILVSVDMTTPIGSS